MWEMAEHDKYSMNYVGISVSRIEFALKLKS